MNALFVKHRLVDLNISKAALAREMGIDTSTLWRFLSGNNVNPPRKTFLVALEVALKRLEAKINGDVIKKTIQRVNKNSPTTKRS